MLAEVRTAEDAVGAIVLAGLAADLARRVELGTASVNHALAIKAKAMRKLADIVDEGQRPGRLPSRETTSTRGCPRGGQPPAQGAPSRSASAA